jgi:hypothetical protein
MQVKAPGGVGKGRALRTPRRARARAGRMPRALRLALAVPTRNFIEGSESGRPESRLTQTSYERGLDSRYPVGKWPAGSSARAA